MLAAEPDFGDVRVIGNLLRNATSGSGNVVHFGGDEIPGARTLHFLHNTVVISGGYSRNVLNIRGTTESANATNNLIRQTGVTVLTFAAGPGTVALGKNLAIPSIQAGANTVGAANLAAAAAPGFVNEAAQDYHLTSTSPAVDAAETLSNGESAPALQFTTPLGLVARPQLGNAADLGALEQGADESRYAKWAYTKFGSDFASTQPNADPDGDGAFNLLEYLRSLDPLTPTLGAAPTVTLNAGHLVLSLNRDPEASDVGCAVEVSSDLWTWKSAAPEIQILTDTPTQFTARDENPNGSPQRFIRLRLSH